MLKIYVARHGQNEDNAQGILNGHRDLPLTALGESQAHKLAEGIRELGMRFDVVYTSPLVRAKRTAEVVCEALDLQQPLVLDALIERDFGIMTGQPASAIVPMCEPDLVRTETVTYFLSPAGAETFPDLLARAGRVLDQIRAEHTSGTILLATHGDLGKMLYAAYYGIPWLDMLMRFHFGNCELLLLAEDADPNVPHVVKIDQQNH